jgi:hypothetical protein
MKAVHVMLSFPLIAEKIYYASYQMTASSAGVAWIFCIYVVHVVVQNEL